MIFKIIVVKTHRGHTLLLPSLGKPILWCHLVPPTTETDTTHDCPCRLVVVVVSRGRRVVSCRLSSRVPVASVPIRFPNIRISKPYIIINFDRFQKLNRKLIHIKLIV